MRTAVRPTVKIDFAELKDFFVNLGNADVTVEAGVSSEGPAAAYVFVWEFGNIRQSKPGPKTVAGVNPVTGEKAFFSTQAPQGYIRVLIPVFREIMDLEIKRISFLDPERRSIKIQLDAAARRITNKMVEVIRNTVPIDSGELRASIRAVWPGETLLNTVAEGFDPDDRVLDISGAFEIGD